MQRLLNPTWSKKMNAPKKKIFVGNLAWKATEDSLRNLFSTVGEVESVKIVMDSYSGKSRGFGFVEMVTEEDAERAVRSLDKKPFLERELRVSLAEDKNDRPRSSSNGPRQFNGHNSRPYNSRNPTR